MSSTGSSRSSFFNAIRLVKNITKGKDVDSSLTSLVSVSLTINQVNYLRLKSVVNKVKVTPANCSIIELIQYKIQILEESERNEASEEKPVESTNKRKIQDPSQGEPVAKRPANSSVSGATGPPTPSTITQVPASVPAKPVPPQKPQGPPKNSSVFGPTPSSAAKPQRHQAKTAAHFKPKKEDHNDALLDFLSSKKTAPVRFNPKKKPEVVAAKPIPNENVAPTTVKKPISIDDMFNDDEKRIRMERLQCQAESKKQKNAETENTLAELRRARKERIEEAQKAKMNGEVLKDIKKRADYNKQF